MTDNVRAFDDNGQEMFLMVSTVICPAVHINEARKISSDHQQASGAKRDTPEMMLPTPLSPSGHAPATHFMCSRSIYRNSIDPIIETLTSNESNGWASGKLYSPDDAPADKFCQVIGSLNDLLGHLGLKEIA